jgi:hypothetical protein
VVFYELFPKRPAYRFITFFRLLPLIYWNRSAAAGNYLCDKPGAITFAPCFHNGPLLLSSDIVAIIMAAKPRDQSVGPLYFLYFCPFNLVNPDAERPLWASSILSVFLNYGFCIAYCLTKIGSAKRRLVPAF